MIYRVFHDMHFYDCPTMEECHEHIKFFDESVEWRSEPNGPKGAYVHHFGCNNKASPYIRRAWMIVELPDDHDLCETCRGVGFVLHFYERGGDSPPSNMYMGCDACPDGRKNTLDDLTERYGRELAEQLMKENSKSQSKN